jgi:hypothetical protein
LINWTWAGGFVLILGTFIAVWPQATGRRKVSYTLEPGKFRPQTSAGD